MSERLPCYACGYPLHAAQSCPYVKPFSPAGDREPRVSDPAGRTEPEAGEAAGELFEE